MDSQHQYSVIQLPFFSQLDSITLLQVLKKSLPLLKKKEKEHKKSNQSGAKNKPVVVELLDDDKQDDDAVQFIDSKPAPKKKDADIVLLEDEMIPQEGRQRQEKRKRGKTRKYQALFHPDGESSGDENVGGLGRFVVQPETCEDDDEYTSLERTLLQERFARVLLRAEAAQSQCKPRLGKVDDTDWLEVFLAETDTETEADAKRRKR
eukprot:TRINITY_DN15854_c0_g1_i3.p1 TRINITY_DN15854_c0_g1~~TRINITY_DN15854_c0_g1_i3.p1  ORF type:complete len:207 (-),score=45.22 TRINITY_DN15854_c0_g1_i3:53-673(-)